MVMKNIAIKNIYYIIALFYVFLGVFFLDWSVRMVPFSGDATNFEIWKTLFQDSFYIFTGILLFLATLLSVRTRTLGDALFKLMMFGGLAMIFGSSLCIMLLNMRKTAQLDYIFDIGVDGFLFVPVIIVFFHRQNLKGNI